MFLIKSLKNVTKTSTTSFERVIDTISCSVRQSPRTGFILWPLLHVAAPQHIINKQQKA
jgi:hypothetical protein